MNGGSSAADGLEQARKSRAVAAAAAANWDGVLEVLGSEDGPEAARWRCFAHNMLALERRDPRLARLVHNTPDSGRVRLLQVGGQQIPGRQASEGAPVTAAGLPPGLTAPAAAQLQQSPGLPVALVGASSVELLRQLGGEVPGRFGQTRAVWIVEPDYELLRATLMVADWRGPEGPLESERFTWFTGPSWRGAMRRHLASATPGAIPARVYGSGRLLEDVRDVLQGYREAQAADYRQRAERFAVLPAAEDFASQIARLRARRGARVLMMASRFTQVVGRSTRELAEAFKELGCEVVWVTEQYAHDQLRLETLQQEAERLAPDVMVAVNHRRSQMPDAVPAWVPYVTVIQDNYDEIARPGAGAEQGPLDLIAGAWVEQYVRSYGYPADRAVDLPRLSSMKPPAPGRGGPSSEVVYVSNHALPPDRLEGRARSLFGGGGAEGQRGIAWAVAWLRRQYDQGSAFGSAPQMEWALMEAAEAEGWRGNAVFSEGCRDQALETLFAHVNSTLYRQQGLRWAAEACAALGLTLKLYGKGWESHPEFAPHSGGWLDGEAALAQVSHGAFANLVLEPFFALTHPRAVDAWMAGGALLLRGRRADQERRLLNAWVERLPPGVWCRTDAEAWLAQHDPADAAALGSFLDGSELYCGPSGRGDAVALATRWREAGVDFMTRLPPGSDQLTFADAQELRGRLSGWQEDPEARSRLAETQRVWVQQRFATTRGAEILLAAAADRLEAVAAEATPAVGVRRPGAEA